MAGEASRSNGDGPTADSYIGSLISLISKSEIRYEGFLFDINTAESSIGLRNVKSFGTEGRKKDGPQVPPSDKVYEYILFRGNDIKDLQVKSSQPVESKSSLFNDPAIIQSHYSQGAATSTSSQTLQAGVPKSTLQGSLPLYQPSPISSSWGLTPVPPITNNTSFPMLLYMQGLYGVSDGIQASQQSPPVLSISPPMQQYPVNSASLPSRTSNFSILPFSVTTASLLPPIGAGTCTLNSNLLSPAQSSALFSDSSTTLVPNKALTQSLPTTASYSSLPLGSPLDSVFDRITFSTSVPDKLDNVSGLSKPYDTGFKSLSSDSGVSGSLLNRGSAPLLVTPNQFLQPGPTSNGLLRPGPTLSGLLQPLPIANQVLQPGPMPNQDLQLGNTASLGPTPSQVFQPGPDLNQLLQTGIATSSLNYSSDSAQKDVEVVQIPSTERPLTTQNVIQAPLLPLPSQHYHKVNGYHSYARYNSRGPRDRLRGHGGARHVTGFKEEFDFTAMNEKFKKDEIWGYLGKSNTTSEEEGSPDKDHAGKSNLELKPVYVKDDFFDSLSCNVSDRGSSKNGMANFSEQRKLDVETFGNYARNRGGHGQSHGGRGYVHGGQGYNRGGRGYVIGNGHGYGGNNGRGYARGNDRTCSRYNQRSYWHHAT